MSAATKATHTPGPWTFEDGVSCLSHKRGEIVARNRAGSQTVAQVVMFSDPSYSGDEDTANARLIAAAPDLLAALRELLALNPHAIGAASARAAIAKATGETP